MDDNWDVWHCDSTQLSILNSALYLDKTGNILDQSDSPVLGLQVYKNRFRLIIACKYNQEEN